MLRIGWTGEAPVPTLSGSYRVRERLVSFQLSVKATAASSGPEAEVEETKRGQDARASVL